MQATPRMIESMELNDWPQDRVNVFIEFWSNHPWRHSDDTFSRRALLVYQGIQRKRWHIAIGTKQSWSLAKICTVTLAETRQDLVRKAHVQQINRLQRSSTLNQPSHRDSPYPSPWQQGRSRTMNTTRRSPPPSPTGDDPHRRSRFRPYSDSLPICAVCLGRHRHRVVDCAEEFTWDKKHHTFATRRIGKSLYTRDRFIDHVIFFTSVSHLVTLGHTTGLMSSFHWA